MEWRLFIFIDAAATTTQSGRGLVETLLFRVCMHSIYCICTVCAIYAVASWIFWYYKLFNRKPVLDLVHLPSNKNELELRTTLQLGLGALVLTQSPNLKKKWRCSLKSIIFSGICVAPSLRKRVHKYLVSSLLSIRRESWYSIAPYQAPNNFVECSWHSIWTFTAKEVMAKLPKKKVPLPPPHLGWCLPAGGRAAAGVGES